MEIESKEENAGAGTSSEDESEEKHLCDSCKEADYNKTTLAERFCIKCELKLCLSCEETHVVEGEHLVVALYYDESSYFIDEKARKKFKESDFCNEHVEVLAEFYCACCELKLCPSCEETHIVGGTHVVMPLYMYEENDRKKFEESEFCTEHVEELAELYCACCREVICSECEQENHSSHNCSRVIDVSELVSKQTEAEYENLTYIQRHLEKERQKLIDKKTEVIRKTKEMDSEIKKRCDEIVAFVYDETKTLLSEVDVFRKERLKEIELERRKMEEHVFAFEKFKDYCDQIGSNINPRRTCKAEGLLRNIMDDLKTRPGGRWKSRLFSVQFSIQKTDIGQVKTSLSAAVGKLTVSCPFKITQSCEVKLDQKEIYGIERLHDKLYVLSDSISIRRLRYPFASVGEIQTPNFKSPKDIVACSKTSCLYVHDKGEDCIWKVSVPDHRVSRWLDRVKEPNALSVTSNAEVLMLRNKEPVCLEIYNEHAILARRFNLPTTVPSLRLIYQTSAGMYTGLSELSLFKFRRDGSVINQFEPANESDVQGKPQCLNLSPYHFFLHCGSVNETRYWSSSLNSWGRSYYSGSISSLTTDLASHQILLDQPDGSNRPAASCYSKKTKQILVLEAVVIDYSTTWKLRVFDVFPQ